MSKHLIYVDTKNEKKEICKDIQKRQIKKQLDFFL